MTDYRPPVVTEDLVSDVVARPVGGDGLLIGLDFDGTLTPIADIPAAPVITPACRGALMKLEADPMVVIAVISGRSLHDLRPRIGVDGVIHWGNHGLEVESNGRAIAHPLADRHRLKISRSTAALADRLAGVPGVWIEDKGLTATVHLRHVSPGRLDEVRTVVETVVSSVGPTLTLEDGKHAIEIRPPVEWDKGAAMAALSSVVGDGWPVLYIGDDETDEDAFRAVRSDGVGVLVGTRRGTDATHRLETRDAVAPFLNRLAAERLGR